MRTRSVYQAKGLEPCNNSFRQVDISTTVPQRHIYMLHVTRQIGTDTLIYVYTGGSATTAFQD